MTGPVLGRLVNRRELSMPETTIVRETDHSCCCKRQQCVIVDGDIGSHWRNGKKKGTHGMWMHVPAAEKMSAAC